MLAGPEVMLVATLNFIINSVASWVVIKLIKLREEVLNSPCAYLGERLLILVSSKSYLFSQNMKKLGLLEFSMLLPARLDLDSDFKSCLEGKMNLRKTEVCTDLWIHLGQSPLEQGHSEHVAQVHIQMPLEDLQGRRWMHSKKDSMLKEIPIWLANRVKGAVFLCC